MIEMTLAIAEAVVRAAQAKAKELGCPITVTVVDEGARLVLCARGDGASIFTTDTSRAKAIPAAVYKKPTAELLELAKAGSPFYNTLPALFQGEVLLSLGGAPIRRGGRVIGGIGCGGGNAEQDHECAIAGAAGADG
jgi:uncharacterized protein GlcG (DUF336 family)